MEVVEVVDVLANWVWQGSAVALAATAILRASRRMSATTRYHLWWVTLLVVLTVPVFSFRLPPSSFQLPAASFQQEAGSLVLPTAPRWTLSLLALVWFAWATVSLSRTLLAVVMLRQTKRALRPFPAAREVRLETWLSLRARGRRAALGVSDRVRAAAVLGLTSPTIVVAPSALETLNDQELNQIVVHEWAHVQRRDDLARLVQRIIVALAGLHPAVWWVDRQLNLERETACDDWAINATGSARGLAVCLTKLAAMPGRPANDRLLPAALLSSELTTRVVRLLDRGRNTKTTRTVGAPMFVAPVLGALALAVASVQLVVTSPMVPDAPGTATSAGPAVVASAESATLAAGSPSPGAAPGTRSPSARATASPRRVAASQARTLGPSTTARDSSEPEGAPERADRDAISTALQQTPRPDVAMVPEVRPGVEGTLGTDLPGLRMPAMADVAPATREESGMQAGAPAGPGPTLWGAAAGAGVTVGQGSQKAAVAAAGFFTRLSKSITGVF